VVLPEQLEPAIVNNTRPVCRLYVHNEYVQTLVDAGAIGLVPLPVPMSGSQRLRSVL
jgi:hypothetical protein